MFAAVCSAPEIHVLHEYFKVLSSISPHACVAKRRVQDLSLLLCSGDESVSQVFCKARVCSCHSWAREGCFVGCMSEYWFRPGVAG